MGEPYRNSHFYVVFHCSDVCSAVHCHVTTIDQFSSIFLSAGCTPCSSAAPCVRLPPPPSFLPSFLSSFLPRTDDDAPLRDERRSELYKKLPPPPPLSVRYHVRGRAHGRTRTVLKKRHVLVRQLGASQTTIWAGGGRRGRRPGGERR